LDNTLNKRAALQGGDDIGCQSGENGELPVLEALESGSVVRAEHADGLALVDERRREAIAPTLRVCRLRLDARRLRQREQGLRQCGRERSLLGWNSMSCVAVAINEDDLGCFRLEAAAHFTQETIDGINRIDGSTEQGARSAQCPQTHLVSARCGVRGARPVEGHERHEEQREYRRAPLIRSHEQEAKRQVQAPADNPTRDYYFADTTQHGAHG